MVSTTDIPGFARARYIQELEEGIVARAISEVFSE